MLIAVYYHRCCVFFFSFYEVSAVWPELCSLLLWYSATTADETKHRWSLSIREEDRAESVPIKDTGLRLNFNTARLRAKSELSTLRSNRGEEEGGWGWDRWGWGGLNVVDSGRKSNIKCERINFSTAVTFSAAFSILSLTDSSSLFCVHRPPSAFWMHRLTSQRWCDFMRGRRRRRMWGSTAVLSRERRKVRGY